MSIGKLNEVCIINELGSKTGSTLELVLHYNLGIELGPCRSILLKDFYFYFGLGVGGID